MSASLGVSFLPINNILLNIAVGTVASFAGGEICEALEGYFFNEPRYIDDDPCVAGEVCNRGFEGIEIQ